MITLRKSEERGHAKHGWLESRHTFSFADYYDSGYMGVGNLRVINEDRVAPGMGFDTHSHRDMEIVSYVLEGELAHKDSMGTGEAGNAHSGVVRPGDVQRMSAGTGVSHSEFNNSRDVEVHFLQIWILPKFRGIRPSYQQENFPEHQRRGKLLTIVSPDGHDGSLSINADATISVGLFDAKETASHELDKGRLAYVHLARGDLRVNGVTLSAGDGMTLEDEAQLVLSDGHHAEVLVFDLAPIDTRLGAR
jgi:redox-sensitive bicupin YhaK (pirin superfamily)